MKLINKLQVERFRGIRDLSIDSLSQINLIVGNNNSGKTSLLEVLQLLREPGSLARLYKLAKLRDVMAPFNANSLYDSIIGMFPKKEDALTIRLSCEYDGKSISYVLSGKESKELLDVNEQTSTVYEATDENGITEIDVFEGQIVCTISEHTFGNPPLSSERRTTPIRLNRLTRVTGTKLSADELIKINYVAPFEHFRGDNISRIIKNDQYKDNCLKTLQLFDPDIKDMTIFRSDVDNRPVEYLKHKRLGAMPLSSFGDGIKKALVLSNAIIGAENGILLIDEIETSIHNQYFDDFFRFLVEACKIFNVQAFITTHSLEAIDGLLNSQEYEMQSNNDDITVITLEREDDKTYSRVLPGREVFEDREAYDFEARS